MGKNIKETDYSKITNIEFDGIDLSDAPDFCDTFITYAEMNGTALTEKQLDELNENHFDLIYEKLIEYIY